MPQETDPPEELTASLTIDGVETPISVEEAKRVLRALPIMRASVADIEASPGDSILSSVRLFPYRGGLAIGFVDPKTQKPSALGALLMLRRDAEKFISLLQQQLESSEPVWRGHD